MDQQAGSMQLPLAYCAVCDREVLTYLGLEDEDPRCCVHCDTPVSEALLRSAAVAELDATGYAEIPPASSCGSGGCGSGGCRR
jgi:hypothetical protein